MKYLAILRDSVREALDTKILYVMMGLAALTLLLLASISYRQLTMEEEVEGVSEKLQFIIGSRMPGIELEVRDFKQLNDAQEPWNGAYEFIHVLRFPKDSEDSPQVKALVRLHETLVRATYWHLNTDSLKTITPEGEDHKNERWLKVVASGTKIKQRKDWTHRPELFFGTLPLPSIFDGSLTGAIYWVETNVVGWVGGGIIVMIGVIATASFIPNMLAKGCIDLILSKPISRTWLLIFKYLGGLTFVFFLTVLVTGGVWLITGIRSGIWGTGILWTAFSLTFFFAILYSFSTLIAVLTRSGVVCILLTCLLWLVLWLVGLGYDTAHPVSQNPTETVIKDEDLGPRTLSTDETMEEPRPILTRKENNSWAPWFRKTLRILYLILPRTDDLDQLTNNLVSQSLLSIPEQKDRGLYAIHPARWSGVILTSLGFIVVMLGLACWRFSSRDY